MKANKKLLFWLLLTIVLILELIFGRQGFYSLWRLKKEKRLYARRVERLREKNKRLMEEVYRLKNDPEYVEAIIRKEMKMVRDNEIIIYFQEENNES